MTNPRDDLMALADRLRELVFRQGQIDWDALIKIEIDLRLAASRPAPQQTTSKLGAWLAAALDDPKVCAEMKADIEAWMNAGEPPYLPAPVDREAVAWPESPIAIAQRGFEKWRAKEHNKKWFRKIDGTPIPNDVDKSR